ncbi:MAG: cytochrome c oxidase accessory protein CcoG [Deltaproteobacteria bacterium]|nr:cytochrome c oxidase accessory protein CcoG [Deltaproteobacteria bacterium]
MSKPETDGRAKIYPRSVSGRFRGIRWAVNASLLGFFFLLPWLKVNGRQVLLFDIPGRKFYVFNTIFWPQEVYYLAILLIFLVVALFAFTAVAGRLWCGYACPQTVFTDIFMKIERMTEGDRAERMRLDSGGFGAGKLLRKALKHGAWLAFSFATAFAFVSYFIPPAELLERIITLNLTGSNLFWLGLFTFTTYGDCGFLRELMCLVPCPYGRFQSALFDTDTLIIGYDPVRGEPRGQNKKGAAKNGGDCVDCTLCVQVCPTGIDIRNGLQYECIACAQCIDACNSVMRKVGSPEGLIRYGSLRSITGGGARVLRPRVIAYAISITLLFGTLAYKLNTRVPLDIEVLRDRTSLYTASADGSISNMYTIKAMNMDTRDHRYMIRTRGIPGAEIVVGKNPITVKSGEVYQTSLALTVKGGKMDKRVSRFDFVIEDVDDPEVTAKRQSTFLVPEARENAVRISMK